MFRSITTIATPLLTAGAIITINTNAIHNDSKRNFYEDDTNVVPVPGTTIPAPASEIESLGNNKLIDGISVRTTKPTENFFKQIREFTSHKLNEFNHWINHNYTKYNETERLVTSTVSDLHYKKEDLLPNGIYVVIGTLAGVIAARPRGIISKISFPIITGLLTFKYFLPVTFDNTTDFAWKLEQRNLPQIAEKQKDAYHSTLKFAKSIENTTENSIKLVENGAQSLKKSIADITGLNLDEEVSKKK
ncbi:uncharacterized protein KGF55_004700 [Candida pseudojiufengensis]|uniref:uncharacterized protein n=1 Tax=Candida pseudojiufengensis TaxID=497109 RepID=UPI00222411C1|nr:uncharacterized protein KGF55_004700 [Candida pseudojiufengensis]KAI5960408.1 hypothetical protein KGF55_004700 [Candida pseudojiufengensis]